MSVVSWCQFSSTRRAGYGLCRRGFGVYNLIRLKLQNVTNLFKSTCLEGSLKVVVFVLPRICQIFSAISEAAFPEQCGTSQQRSQRVQSYGGPLWHVICRVIYMMSLMIQLDPCCDFGTAPGSGKRWHVWETSRSSESTWSLRPPDGAEEFKGSWEDPELRTKTQALGQTGQFKCESGVKWTFKLIVDLKKNKKSQQQNFRNIRHPSQI